MIMYHVLIGRAYLKGWSISSSLLLAPPRSNDMFQVGPAHHGLRKGVRLQSIFFVSASPGRRTKLHPRLCSAQTRGRLYGPEFPQMSIRNDVRCLRPIRRDVHITDNMPGCTDTFSTTLAYPASSPPSEASRAAWPSSGLAMARKTTLFVFQPTDHRRPVVYRYGVHAGTAFPHRTHTRAEPNLHLPLA